MSLSLDAIHIFIFHPWLLQEMFAFAVTPGLANRTFATAARIAYLRYGVLLLGVRVSLNKDDNDGSSSVFRVSLFPEDLVLEVR